MQRGIKMPRNKKKKLKKRADGRYVCYHNGIFFYGQTSDEALQKREQYLELEAAGMKTDTITVYEYAERWLPISKVGIRDHTYNGYAKMIDDLVDVVGKKT